MAHRNRWYIPTKNSDFPQQPLKLPEDIYRPDVFNHRSTHISSINIHKLYQQNPDAFFFFSNHLPIIHLSIYIYLLVNHPFHPHIFQGTAGSLWWGAGDGDLGAARSVDLQCPGFQNKRWNHGAKMGVYSIIYNRDIWTYMNNYEHIIIYIMIYIYIL